MELRRLDELRSEQPKRGNRYSRKARQERAGRVRAWAYFILSLASAFAMMVLAIPKPQSSTNDTEIASFQLPHLGGARAFARDAQVIDATEPAETPDMSVADTPEPARVAAGKSSARVAAQETPASQRKAGVQYVTHEVRRGESLSVIARSYRVDWYTLLSVNRLKSSRSIHPGDKLRVPDRRGLLHVIEKDDTLEDISLAYDVTIDKIVDANALEDPDVVKVGQELFLPSAKIPRFLIRTGRTNAVAVGRNRTRAERFASPAPGPISSGYGYRTHPISGRWTMHKGVDYATGSGYPIRAARSGTVSYAGRLGGYGNLVVVDHESGYSTRYAHASRILVKRGQKVKQGARIALVGDTGYTTGPHLHFEVWRDGKSLDPVSVLRR
ncbi:M23 family metallopeptidase [Candidatus Poribacteria bacterium]|nr:M23 family metallopeptidase [Candidatus Poribacteria bacterium]